MPFETHSEIDNLKYQRIIVKTYIQQERRRYECVSAFAVDLKFKTSALTAFLFGIG